MCQISQYGIRYAKGCLRVLFIFLDILIYIYINLYYIFNYFKIIFKSMKWGADNRPFGIKIGINAGEVIAGIIGYHKKQFCLVGDTVNIA